MRAGSIRSAYPASAARPPRPAAPALLPRNALRSLWPANRAVMKNDTTRTPAGGCRTNQAISADLPAHAGPCHHTYEPPSGFVQNAASSASSASRPTSCNGKICCTCCRYTDRATGRFARYMTPVFAMPPGPAVAGPLRRTVALNPGSSPTRDPSPRGTAMPAVSSAGCRYWRPRPWTRQHPRSGPRPRCRAANPLARKLLNSHGHLRPPSPGPSATPADPYPTTRPQRGPYRHPDRRHRCQRRHHHRDLVRAVPPEHHQEHGEYSDHTSRRHQDHSAGTHTGIMPRLASGLNATPLVLRRPLNLHVRALRLAAAVLRRAVSSQVKPSARDRAVAVLSVNEPWPLASMLPIAANSWSGQVRSRPSSRVRSPGSSTGAVVLRSQTALTGSARPWTIRSGSRDAPQWTGELRRSSGPGLLAFAPADRRWRRRSGSASGSEGVRAVSAARAARRAALKPYRKFSHGLRHG